MPQEIVWGARFQRMIHFNQQYYNVDYSNFNSIYNDNFTTTISAKQIHHQQQQND
jgi:hypothetical protein